MRHWRRVCYDPWQLQALETTELAASLVEAGADPDQAQKLAAGLQAAAYRAVALFGTRQHDRSPYVDCAALHKQALRGLRILAVYEEEHQLVQRRVQRRYRRLHPSATWRASKA
jgi:hypothetical protein